MSASTPPLLPMALTGAWFVTAVLASWIRGSPNKVVKQTHGVCCVLGMEMVMFELVQGGEAALAGFRRQAIPLSVASQLPCAKLRCPSAQMRQV